MQWLRDPNQGNVNNPDNVRQDANSHFRNKKKKYLKANSKINVSDLFWAIDDFKKSYQPRTKIVKDEKGDLVTDSHSTLAR